MISTPLIGKIVELTSNRWAISKNYQKNLLGDILVINQVILCN